MTPNDLHGHMLTAYATDHKLAEIAADLVEIKHMLRRREEKDDQQAEILRQVALQLKVFEIQIGILRESIRSAQDRLLPKDLQT